MARKTGFVIASIIFSATTFMIYRMEAAQTAVAATADAGVHISRVRLSTGVELEVAQAGPEDGEPVLFLHGYTDSWFSFSELIKHLPLNVRAIVPSQRGHGDSEAPACCYRLSDFAADAVALLDKLGVERAAIVGHSMGSLVAQRVAIEHPQRVSALVLIGSGPTARTQPILELSDAVRELEDPVPAEFVREFQASTVFAPLPDGFLDRVVRESRKLKAQVWREALAGLIAPEAAHRLERIQARTLILWGDQDGVFDRSAQDALLRSIRGARLIVYEGVGHAPNWEQAARAAADINAFLLEGSAAAQRRERDMHGGHGGSTSENGRMRLLDGLGDWHMPVTTSSTLAQQYFDQGLRLMYAFNHDEAVRSFEEAVRLDSACAMCYWGIAYGLGPNINLPMEAANEPRALEAIRAARRHATRVTPIERGLIDAMVVRYGEPAGAQRAQRDSAFATAMRTLAGKFDRNADVLVIYADAMLNLRPWNQWTRAGTPQPGTLEVIDALERAMKLGPTHAGACHFYVHSVEASPTPERALECAGKLSKLMPGAGHIVHMPAHVYLRVGRYEDAARANIAAVEADHRYFASHDAKPGMYPMFYAPHNLHFLWSAYLLSGQKQKALGTAAALRERVSIEDARAAASLEAFLTAPILTHVRFGDWQRALAEAQPPRDLQYLTGMWHYGRGMARAARGELKEARVELDSVRAIAARVTDDMIIILNSAPALLNLAAEVLAGEIALQGKQYNAAIEHLRAAVAMEDALTYDEPPPWYHSTRNMLGRALLLAGRTAEAERTFKEDLQYLRETGWSLGGLESALRAQGKTAEADKVSQRVRAAWQYADVPVPFSTR